MKNINKEDSLRAYIRHLPLRPMKMYVPPGTMVWIIIMIAIVFYAISLEEQGMQYTVLRIGGGVCNSPFPACQCNILPKGRMAFFKRWNTGLGVSSFFWLLESLASVNGCTRHKPWYVIYGDVYAGVSIADRYYD